MPPVKRPATSGSPKALKKRRCQKPQKPDGNTVRFLIRRFLTLDGAQAKSLAELQQYLETKMKVDQGFLTPYRTALKRTLLRIMNQPKKVLPTKTPLAPFNRPPRPMNSLNKFKKYGNSIEIKMLGASVYLEPRVFDTGTLGWRVAQDKAVIRVANNIHLNVRLNMMLLIPGSKNFRRY